MVNDRPPEPGWWNRRWILTLVLLATLLPMLVVDLVPLTDLPGHMGRYRVQLDLARVPGLERFYAFEWKLIGNLGVDLAVVPLAPLLGLEGAVKLVVGAIPMLTAAGFLAVAKVAHGRVPPTAFWAIPLVYGYPFHFGFVNFALSMALAFLAFAYWMHLGRQERWRLRAALFVPIGLALWTTHVFGWAVLCLLAAGFEIVAQRARSRGWPRAIGRAALHGLALAPPLLLMAAWRSEAAGDSFGWFQWDRKAHWLTMALRDRWQAWDMLSVDLLGYLILLVVPMQLLMRRRRTGFDPGLGLGAVLLCLAFVLLPRTLFGSAYADMRLVPFAIAALVLAIRPDAWGPRQGQGRVASAVAAAGLVFAGARLIGNAESFRRHDAVWKTELAALDRLPRGARLVTLLPQLCPSGWGTPRFDHLPAIALVRRHAFANDQWTMAGAQLLNVRYARAGVFAQDPSQFVALGRCRLQARRTLDEALAQIPRDAFDYLWLIDPPRHDPRLLRGLRPVWRHGTSVLFHVERQLSSWPTPG